jgi:hypothetical protein
LKDINNNKKENKIKNPPAISLEGADWKVLGFKYIY